MITRIYYHPEKNKIVYIEERGIAPVRYLRIEKNEVTEGLYSVYLMHLEGFALIGVEDEQSESYRL